MEHGKHNPDGRDMEKMRKDCYDESCGKGKSHKKNKMMMKKE